MPQRAAACAIHGEGEIGLADDAEQPRGRHARNLAHHIDDFIALFFKRLEVVAVDLDRQLALDAADGLFHVVFDRLREAPDHAGNLLQLLVHGGDQVVLVLMEDRTPLFLGLQIDVVFGVEESGPVGAVVGTANLIDHVGDFRKAGHDQASLLEIRQALIGAGGRSKRAAHPERSFIQVRQKLGTDDAAVQEEDRHREPRNADANELRDDEWPR
jgi:hypothetical protein